MSNLKPRAIARLAVGDAERRMRKAEEKASRLTSLVAEYKSDMRDRDEQVRGLGKQIGRLDVEVEQQRKAVEVLHAYVDKQVERAESAEVELAHARQELATIKQSISDAIGIKVKK